MQLAHRFKPGQRSEFSSDKPVLIHQVHLSTAARFLWPRRHGDPLPPVTPVCVLNRRIAKPLYFWVSCPNEGCGHFQDAVACTLWRSAKPTSLKCKRCGTTRVSTKWLCECKVQWFDCPVHREPGLSCGSQRVLKRNAQVVRTASAPANASRSASRHVIRRRQPTYVNADWRAPVADTSGEVVLVSTQPNCFSATASTVDCNMVRLDGDAAAPGIVEINDTTPTSSV